MLRSRRPRCARSDISLAIAKCFDGTLRPAPVAAPQEAGQ